MTPLSLRAFGVSILAVCTAWIALGTPALAETSRLEQATAHLYLNTGVLEDAGIGLTGAAGVPDPVEKTMRGHVSTLTGRLEIRLPGGSYEGFGSGALSGGAGPTLTGSAGSAALAGYALVADTEALDLRITSATGEPLFTIDHVHVHHDAATGSLAIRNADVRLTPALATQLGEPRLAGLAVGLFEADTSVVGPLGPAPSVTQASRAATSGPATQGASGGDCVTPNFTLPIDVALIGIDSLSQSALEQGRVAITPSATLENVGMGDVRWEAPLDEDHPMLAWAMYRESGGAFEPLGASTTKHAFFAVNTGCPCAGGSVLWAAGCQDEYGTFTNEDRSNLAPRDEITAHSVDWTACGSFFDPDCDSAPNFPAPADGLERRMHVAESELQVAGANYYIEAWYLVQNDIDIFNTMGWRKVTPIGPGSSLWTFDFDTPLANGPALDAWVPRGTLTADESAQVLDTGVGEVEVAAKVTDLGGGQYRYEYALMNFDYDRQVRQLLVPMVPGTSVTQLEFSDATDATSDDWTLSLQPGFISFEAPASDGADWGEMRRFAFTADQASQPGSVTLIPLEAGSPGLHAVSAAVPLPEPGSALALATGAATLLGLARRRSG